MLKENQFNADSINGVDEGDSSFTGPYRHAGYKRALSSLREALNYENAVILKGVEGTGKTTLAHELISEFQHKGVPVAIFNDPLTKTSQLYSKLADTLEVPKQKKDLIRALRNTKEAGQFCLVVIDQQAINSNDSVVDALQQLCQTSETTAGSIKLVVIRQDYMVLHPEGLQQADFSNWINIEVTLDPLHIDDIEGYIYYLSAIKGLPPTPYEIGTDFMMVEQTEGRLSRLKALLLPLIHKDVITRGDFQSPERKAQPLASANSGIYALGFAVILALGVGINHFFLSDTPSSESNTADNTPIFAESTPVKKETPVSVAPPNISADQQEQLTNDSTIYQGDTLPALSPEPAPKDAPQKTSKIKQIAQESEIEAEQEFTKSTEEIAALPAAEFQAEVNSKLIELEQQLSAAVEENNRLKHALETAEKEKQEKALAIASNKDATTASDISNKTETIITEAKPTTETLALTEKQGSNNMMPIAAIDAEETNQAPIATTPIKEVAPETPVAVEAEVIALTPGQKEIVQPVEQPPSALTLVTENIDRWTNAWQSKDYETYTARYTADFNGAYRTHQRWLKKRYDAINRPEWIKLIREELHNIQATDTEIKVDFWLKYEAANGYKDKTLKRLTLVKQDNDWLIAKEQNIKVEPYF